MRRSLAHTHVHDDERDPQGEDGRDDLGGRDADQADAVQGNVHIQVRVSKGTGRVRCQARHTSSLPCGQIGADHRHQL